MSLESRLAALAAVIIGASGALLSQPAVATTVSHRCSTRRAVRSDSTAIVYRTAAAFDDGVGNPVALYYACVRSNGASVAIASASQQGEYLPNDVLKQLVLAGDYAGSIMVQGEGDRDVCQKYAQPPCPVATTVVRAADARSGSLTAIRVPSGTHGLVLAPSREGLGAAAWLQVSHAASTLVATELVRRGARLGSAPYVLDTGDIANVRVNGETVSWRNGGAAHRATLRATG